MGSTFVTFNDRYYSDLTIAKKSSWNWQLIGVARKVIIAIMRPRQLTILLIHLFYLCFSQFVSSFSGLFFSLLDRRWQCIVQQGRVGLARALHATSSDALGTRHPRLSNTCAVCVQGQWKPANKQPSCLSLNPTFRETVRHPQAESDDPWWKARVWPSCSTFESFDDNCTHLSWNKWKTVCMNLLLLCTGGHVDVWRDSR